MSYKRINSNSILEEACIKVYDVNSSEWSTLIGFGFSGIPLKELMKNTGGYSNVVRKAVDEIDDSSKKRVILSYKFNGSLHTVSIYDTISDVSKEHFNISLSSSFVLDSIILGRDLVMETSKEYITDSKNCSSIEEYYDSYKSKEYLTQYIIDALIENKFLYSNKFGFKEEVCLKTSISEIKDDMLYIPDKNVRNVAINVDDIIYKCSHETTYSNFMKCSAREGLLKFKPYCTINKDGIYTLVLKYNRFVHLFRDYEYQCSYTADGVGSYSHSGVRINQIRNLFLEHGLGQSNLLKYLYYMNLIQCCKCIDEFNDLLKMDSELVDKFMELSTKHLFESYNVKYVDDVISSIVSLVGHGVYHGRGPGFLEEPKEVYRVPASDTADYARINIYSSNQVGIEVWVDECVQEVLFTLPSAFNSDEELNSIAEGSGETPEDMSNTINSVIYNNYEVRCALIAFALNFCGFIANFITTHPVEGAKAPKLRALNKLNILEFNNLKSLLRPCNVGDTKLSLLNSIDKMN